MDLLKRAARGYWRLNMRAWPAAKEPAWLFLVLLAVLLLVTTER